MSEIELAARFCRGPIIAVTGTNGKTTVCHLIHRMIRESARPAVLCGNVGFSFLDALPEISRRTVVVLELSSFQLEDCPTFRPSVAVVLNVSPNHLDRHGSLAVYARAKENIFRNQRATDAVLLHYENPITRRMAARARSRVRFFGVAGRFAAGYSIERGWIVEREPGHSRKILPVSELGIPGRHNLENAMAASGACRLVGVPPGAIRRAARKFRTLEHRIEPAGEVRGVRFVNDSKSTTPASTAAAIEAIPGPVVLVAGGRPKGAPFETIAPLLKARVRRAVLYGEARDLIAAAWPDYPHSRTEADFRRAVWLAFEEARPGDTVLLSPMCTSFDQFSSYEARGLAFKKIVGEIRERTGAPLAVGKTGP